MYLFLGFVTCFSCSCLMLRNFACSIVVLMFEDVGLQEGCYLVILICYVVLVLSCFLCLILSLLGFRDFVECFGFNV